MRRRNHLIGASGVQAQAIQIATRAEQNFVLSGALNDTNRKGGARVRSYFSMDCDNVQLGMNNFYVADINGSNLCIETNNGNSYDLRASLEYNGQSIMLTWNGSQTRTVAAGEALALSDPIKASAFGLSKFTAGDEFWLRMERLAPNGGTWLYQVVASNSPTINGERWFIGATTANDQLLATGDWPLTGGWSAHGVIWLPALIIGKPIDKSITHMASVVVGASIEHGSGDTGRGDGFNGSGGYVRRGYVNGKGAKIGLMKPGESAKSFVQNSAKRREYLRYANHAWTAHGGNDYTYGETVGNTQTQLSQIWAWLKAEGLYVHHIALTVKTDSTDAWATVVNQTPRAGFATGGNWRDVVNTWAAGKVGTEIDAYDDFDTETADSVSIDKWRVDLGQPTADGTHPNAVLHGTMATQFATLIAADKAIIEV